MTNNPLNPPLLRWKMLLGVILILSFLLTTFTIIHAETVVVHANVVWEMTDVVAQEGMVLRWEVDKNDLWNCNPQLFPSGHTADGIPVNALKDYVLPDQPIGMLIGRFGDCGRLFPMGTSGSIHIRPSEDGEFLYLTMNDDTIGLYGKGFKDNEGKLIVTINQTRKE